MRVLAFDTADDYCTLVLTQDGAVLAERSITTGRNQAAVLAPLTQEILKEKQLTLSAIDRLAVCTGPGSFTGLRVGLAFARGLSLAGGKPLYGFDHFTCIKAALKRNDQNKPTLIIRESKREELFAELNGEMFLATADALIEKLRSAPGLFFTGNGMLPILEKAPELAPRCIIMTAEERVLSAALMAEEASSLPSAPPEPLYLRDADVTFPKSA